MKRLVLAIIIFLLSGLVNSRVLAQPVRCTNNDPCAEGQTCAFSSEFGTEICQGGEGPTSGNADLNQVFGNFSDQANLTGGYSGEASGLITLLSNVLRIAVVAAGLFGLINLLISGIQYIGSSGNPDIIKLASSRIWMSLLGLVIVAGAFVIAGVIGLLFFGSATALINPVIFGPGGGQ